MFTGIRLWLARHVWLNSIPTNKHFRSGAEVKFYFLMVVYFIDTKENIRCSLRLGYYNYGDNTHLNVNLNDKYFCT